ncbi:ligase-associated DNA damage response endonuclease PdeM [Sphingorhabdus sp.]|jgi:DNA ligase-associated metallophosphoesterase|uniref:ligase-associated DNA damage response endonuclease PdeM n=1 Tax=Sphingorhabdus sp. TaxID=1902408 RepID=UPI003BB196CA|nr:ligase-associated DNA damage response endonuclease PdeM [Sphingomonadales bacterium]MBK9432390.1 ligase-associated DNA damage response endonuclease PdeM [Sphingomonadales bacterium]MBL0022073.1 ligase-associated DNA damage response endonuclease PdeM [Sphingomonadales bacterium]
MPRSFNFAGIGFVVAGEAALYWPSQQALLVADLHLEKGSAFASHGQMLPPYDSLATLEAIEKLVAAFTPQTLYCLGDNFHDSDGENRLGGAAADLLKTLTHACDWVWIVGNHDPDIGAQWGGRIAAECRVGSIDLRHEAAAAPTTPEISGHYHPKFRQQLRGRMVSRRCILKSATRMILPSFGAYTGGLDVTDPAFAPLWQGSEDSVEALVPTTARLLRFPLSV